MLILRGCFNLLVVYCFFIITYADENIDDDDEWVDPFDMLNYDHSTQTMKKPAESSSYGKTKRKDFNSESCQRAESPDITECTNKLNMLQKEIMEHKRKGQIFKPHPTCHPVFKRFLLKLLKEIGKIGLPTDASAEEHYDAEVKLSKQMVEEIQNLVNDDGRWRTGALDNALSQILVNFKFHDYEAWKWRFEDTFGVEPYTILMVSLCVLVIVAIICTELWSTVSWFVQFRRMFAICFFISLIWNWFYLYKTAFAEHQANIVKMENVNEKCTGLKKLDWKDNIKEWFRTTWTLQDDPCKMYYEVLVVNPILLVPPMKAITMTLTTFITDPLKHLGQGISEFLRALFKDLPVTLQIPVLLLITAAIVVFMYSCGQAAVQHAFLRPLRGGRRDPFGGIEQQPQNPPLQGMEEEQNRARWAGGDANHRLQPRQLAGQEGNRANQRANLPNQENHEPEVRHVETLRNADDLYLGDETDVQNVAPAEDSVQHAEEEPVTDDNVTTKENEASAEKTVLKPPQAASKSNAAKGDNVDTKTSGNATSNMTG
ncbi:chloride channel CLIC-like protein 1 isoform X2 [Trichomycterus rosablanca]|uniref:chloride channel CLIC-like protein 1 isoform X2 n=1 Tax=Trichomycterus rosablanca TaxID=2290929 RepID=UPI002F3584F7